MPFAARTAQGLAGDNPEASIRPVLSEQAEPVDKKSSARYRLAWLSFQAPDNGDRLVETPRQRHVEPEFVQHIGIAIAVG